MVQEPFGLTLIEAAAHGLPLVATKFGGPVEIIATLNNGVLVRYQMQHYPTSCNAHFARILRDGCSDMHGFHLLLIQCLQAIQTWPSRT